MFPYLCGADNNMTHVAGIWLLSYDVMHIKSSFYNIKNIRNFLKISIISEHITHYPQLDQEN